MESRRFQVSWILAGLAVGLMLLLASCSAPPPRPRTSSRPPATHVDEPDRSSERTRRAVELTEAPPATAVTEPADKSHIAGVETPPVPTSRSRKRLAGYPGEVVNAVSQANVALTFDAGASPVPGQSILKTLKSSGIHVTFFVTGKWAEQNPELVRQIAAEGHEIGNHSYSHPDFRKLADDAIVEQLRKTDEIVTRLTGQSTKPLFRFPSGGRDKRVLQVIGEEGYRSVYWSVDSWDAFKKGITGEEIEQRVLRRIQPGDIVLMHVGSAPTAQMLPDLIEKLRARGYQIVKVSELLSGAE